jgi:hypothetical protein
VAGAATYDLEPERISSLESIHKLLEIAMKKFLTFQNFPMVLVVGLIVWAWISLLSVLAASLF